MEISLKQERLSLDFTFQAPEKKEYLTQNGALEGMSTNETRSENGKPLLIKRSSSEHQLSSPQDMELDENQPKQEYKPTIHDDNTAAMPIDEPDTNIKQEELLKKVSLPPIDTSQLDYYYRCQTCSEIMSSLTTYLNHLESVHTIKHRNNTIKHVELEPDIHNAERFCRSCEKMYADKDKYWYHLKFTHYMVLKSTAAEALPANKGIQPVPQDPDFYCRVCEIKYADKKAYNQHIGTVHNMYLRSRRNLNIMPQWDSPNNYCRACQYSYAGKYNYRLHCRRVHSMTAPVKRDKNGQPDLHDLNNYCKVCDFTYKTQKLYRSHCNRLHRTKPTIKTPDTTPDPKNPNNYCSSCDKTYLRASSYRTHLITAHKMTHLSTVSQRNMIPDADDPNGYCCACERTYSSIYYYKVHVATFHATSNAPQTTHPTDQPGDQQAPDADDLNFYCRACQKTFLDQSKYRSHLRGAHKMKLKSMRSPSDDPNFLPDPLDPNFYCRVCKTTSKTNKLFRRHCRRTHQMTLDPISLPNPDAEIDVNSPECYCAKCEIYIKRISNFRRHLRVKHKLQFSCKRGRP